MKTFASFIFICVLVCTNAVRAETLAELSARVNRLETSVKKVQKNVSDARAASKKTSAEDNEDSADAAFMKAQDLEQTVRSLTGDLETLRFKVEKLEERVNKINQDNNLRFKDLEDKIAKVQGQMNKAAAAERKAAKEKEKAKAKEEATAKAEKDKIAKIKAEYGNLQPNELYSNAFSALKKNDYKNAEARFEAFTILHPKHKLAGNAQYWMGESFYARGDYNQAAVAFADGFKMYRDSQKAPDNLLKLGLTLARLNKKKEACIAFKNFSKEYPKVSDAMKKRLETETKKAGCE